MANVQQSTAMLLREAPPALRALAVEAMLINQTSFGGATVPYVLDLPFVSVSCALLLNPEPADHSVVADDRQQHQLPELTITHAQGLQQATNTGQPVL
jgi:hypothetical protein